MNVIVIRHGQTEGNQKGVVYGHPKRGLSAIGSEQVRQAALQLKNEHLDAIYSSDLQRCIETTEVIRRYHPSVPLTYVASLREIGGGNMYQFPLRLPSWLHSRLVRLVLRIDFDPPGGESWRSLKLRVADFLNEIYEMYPSATVLLVTHNVVIQAVHSLLKNPGDAEIIGKVVPNCGTMSFTMVDHINSRE